MNDKTKGIRQEMFAYKNINDSEWTEGRFPNEITIGDTYLIKYQVKDAEGTLSFPAVYVVKTNECRSYKEIVDENPPSVVIIPEKYEIGVGEEIKIEGYADDDYGIEEYEMFIDDEKVLDHMGRCTYVGKKEGTVIVKANATDIVLFTTLNDAPFFTLNGAVFA